MNLEWKSNTLKTIERIFQDQFFDESIKIVEETTPAEIDQWDSLGQVNLLAAIEHEFGVRFTADEMASIDSVGKILVSLARCKDV